MTDLERPYALGTYVVLNDGVVDQFGGEVVPGDVATVLETVTDEDGDTWVWVKCGGRYLCKPEWFTAPDSDSSRDA